MRSGRNAASWVDHGTIVVGEQRIAVAAATEIGATRAVNEDAVAIDVARGAALVVDGCGGDPPGIAAERVCEAFLDTIHRGDGLADALRAGGRAVDRDVATAVAAAFRDGSATVAHVGDCRAYLVRDGVARAVTRDHTLDNQVIDAGLLAPADAAGLPLRNVLVHALGLRNPTPHIEVAEVALEPGDALVLCSNGIHDALDETRLAALAGGAALDAVRAIIAAAREAGHGHDSASVVLCRLNRS